MAPTQARLLEIAAELFAEQGYAAVSMRQIARTAGITAAAIYNHYANKDELYFAAVAYLTEEKTDHITPLVEGAGSAEDRFRALVESMMQMFNRDPLFRKIYFRELLEGDKKRLRQLGTKIFSGFQGIIEELLARVAPHLDSRLALFSLAGLMLHHLEARELASSLEGARPEHSEVPVLADHITRVFLGQSTAS